MYNHVGIHKSCKHQNNLFISFKNIPQKSPYSQKFFCKTRERCSLVTPKFPKLQHWSGPRQSTLSRRNLGQSSTRSSRGQRSCTSTLNQCWIVSRHDQPPSMRPDNPERALRVRWCSRGSELLIFRASFQTHPHWHRLQTTRCCRLPWTTTWPL